MRAHIEHHEPVVGDPSAIVESFRGDPGQWLPGPARAAGPHRWRLDLHAGPARHEAIVEVGATGAIPSGTRRSVGWWAPDHDRVVEHHAGLFPYFHGEMTLRANEDGADLHITGDYVPPGGVIGALVDVTAGRPVARATVHWIAGEIAAGLAAASVTA